MPKKNEQQLPEYAPDAIYELVIKKGMEFILLSDEEGTGSKRGDIVKISSVSSIFKGMKSNGHYNDYELLRVTNGKFSWRISRGCLFPITK